MQTLADLGWAGARAVARGGRRVAARRAAGDRPAAPRSRPAVRRRADRPADAARRRRRVRGALGRRLDLVRARQRRRRASCAPAGSSAAGRCARGSRAATAAAAGAVVAAREPARAAGRARDAAARRSASRLVLAIALAAAWTRLPARAGRARRRRGVRPARPRASRRPPRRSRGIATKRNPLSVDPLFELAAIEQARGRTTEATAALERAVDLQPANAEAWRRLGRLRLSVLNDPKGALSAFQAAYYLDPQSPASTSDVLEASRALQSPTGAAGQRRKAGPQERRPAPRAHAHVLEAGLAQRRRQRRARVEAQVLAERVEVRVEPQRARSAPPSRRPWNGTVTSSLPPGRSTRRASSSACAVSATCSSTSEHHTRSTLACSSGSEPSGSIARRSAPGALRRARSSAASAISTPTGSAPAARSAATNRPAPQPRSSTRSPGRASASSSARRRSHAHGSGSCGASAQKSS